MTRTDLEAGSVGILRQRNEPKNPHPERETGGLCELLARLDGKDAGSCRQASSTIRAQAAELERLRGALLAIWDATRPLSKTTAKRLLTADQAVICAVHAEAARALNTEGTSE